MLCLAFSNRRPSPTHARRTLLRLNQKHNHNSPRSDREWGPNSHMADNWKDKLKFYREVSKDFVGRQKPLFALLFVLLVFLFSSLAKLDPMMIWLIVGISLIIVAAAAVFLFRSILSASPLDDNEQEILRKIVYLEQGIWNGTKRYVSAPIKESQKSVLALLWKMLGKIIT
jgi:hypothetical protein